MHEFFTRKFSHFHVLVLLVFGDGSEEVGVGVVAGDGALGAVGDDNRLEVLGHAGHRLDGVRTRRTCKK